MKKKMVLGSLAAAALVAPLAAISPAAAAVPANSLIINGDFEEGPFAASDFSALPTNGGITRTDFTLATEQYAWGAGYTEESNPDAMWQGRYAISTNPYTTHGAWYNVPSDDHKMIVNGFDTGANNQVVWEQDVNLSEFAAPECYVGASVNFDFSAVAYNVLDPAFVGSVPSGNLSVYVGTKGADPSTFQPVGAGLQLDPTTGDAQQGLAGQMTYAPDITVQIRNSETVHVGNDFALNDISLVPSSTNTDGTFNCGTTFPVPASFNADPTDGTCDAAGAFAQDPAWGTPTYDIDNVRWFAFADDTALRVDRRIEGQVTLYLVPGPNVTIEGLSDAWWFEGDGYWRVITLDPQDTTSEECVADIGGKTIGFWGSNNQNGTAAGAPIWNAAKAGYANAIPASTTFTQAQALLNVSGSTNLGKDMLRAQFIATALNVKYIDGYGDQHITVPLSSAVDGGSVVTVKEYLAHVNAAWASLDTKAEITSVKNVLDAINQDAASVLFV